jgi:glycosyltransferase involved in cell wall biosynthesis
MKVLWFANTAGNGSEYLNNNSLRGGWIEALDRRLQDQDGVELSVAFYHHAKVQPFRYGKTTYYPIYFGKNRNGRLQRYVRRVQGALEPEQDIEKFVDIVEKVSPDIIHVHGTENPFAWISRSVGVPTVVSIQGIMTVYAHKFFAGIDCPSALAHTPLSKLFFGKDFTAIYRRFRRMAMRERRMLAISRNIIGRTDWDRRVMKILAPNAHYYHCDELLREQFYGKQWKPKEQHDPIVLHSTIGPSLYKGLETIYRTAEILANSHGLHFEWNVVGVDAKAEVSRLVRRTLRPQAGGVRVNLLGNLGADDLVRRLLTSSVYVHPSHIENSANSICEAMILGLPVVASYSGGTSTLIESNREGVLVQDGDPYSLAGAIIELVRSPEVMLEYGKRARDKAVGRHDQQAVVTRMLQVYEDIIRRSRSCSA